MASELERRLRRLEAATARPPTDTGPTFIMCACGATARDALGEPLAVGVFERRVLTRTGLGPPLPPDGRMTVGGLPVVDAAAIVPGPVILQSVRKAEAELRAEQGQQDHAQAAGTQQPSPQPTQPLLPADAYGGFPRWEPWREPVRKLTPAEQRRQHFIERAGVRLPRGYGR